MEEGATAFGAPWAEPARACAVLRAQARRIGVPVKDASSVDLTAAVVGAHLWCVFHNATSFSQAYQHPTSSAEAAAYVLARAAGEPLHGWGPPEPSLLTQGHIPLKKTHLALVAKALPRRPKGDPLTSPPQPRRRRPLRRSRCAASCPHM